MNTEKEIDEGQKMIDDTLARFSGAPLTEKELTPEPVYSSTEINTVFNITDMFEAFGAGMKYAALEEGSSNCQDWIKEYIKSKSI